MTAMNEEATKIIVSPRQFPLVSDHGIGQRIASLLDWAARIAPGQPLSYAEIAQAVLGLRFRLGGSSDLTLAIREDVYGCRDRLATKFSRALITDGNTARASVDGAEAFRFRLVRDVSKLQGGLTKMLQTRQVITAQGLDPLDFPGFAAFCGLTDHEMTEELGPSLGRLLRALDHVDLSTGEIRSPGERAAAAGRLLN